MTKYSYQDAKAIIHTICKAAEANEYNTREKFMDMLQRNPHIASQGYNAFGKVFFWNDASYHLYGYREDEAVNRDIVELIIPPEMRQFARDMIANARKTNKMPEAGAYDLLRSDEQFVTVFSGHLVFQWDKGTMPEFYCIDLALETQEDELATIA
ncbi:PAS domain-containing protein [Pontiella sulfatireligans]|uniref:PAS domain-containing protein n=1 Tax=Pontiella sulfatireligans TaxID=2750658 RepID=A0A6C2UPH9_9BACT|nr:PAS domain-containing protein [Pontiella sulfatireligans]VGO22108.1 hypothetical protein SCARR_04189 [Pontiella sulfatireligans]